MMFGAKLAEGKTKVIYAHPSDGALAIIQHKDSISAGDGARRNTIAGKGALSGQTAAHVFTLLNRSGIATHYIDAPEPTVMVVRRCTMLPIEVVMRRLATGSYLKRNQNITEGTRFEPALVEFFLKDDARHDPQISAEEIAQQGLASADEVDWMIEEGRRVFGVLEQAWAAQDVTLVDMKIEFGRPVKRGTGDKRSAGEGYGWGMDSSDGKQATGDESAASDPQPLTPDPLLVADMIDNDSWRIWPGGEKDRMLDKQIYRNMQQVTNAGLTQVHDLYATVAGMTAEWVK